MAIAAQALTEVNQAAANVHDVRTSIDFVKWRARLDDLSAPPSHAVTVDAALDTWGRWAAGQTVGHHQLGEAVAVLRQQAIVDPVKPSALADAAERVMATDGFEAAHVRHEDVDDHQVSRHT
jgi:hypothetical protein